MDSCDVRIVLDSSGKPDIRFGTTPFLASRLQHCDPMMRALSQFTGCSSHVPVETFREFMEGLQHKLGYGITYGYAGILSLKAGQWYKGYPFDEGQGYLETPFRFMPINLRSGSIKMLLVAVSCEDSVTVWRSKEGALGDLADDTTKYTVYADDKYLFTVTSNGSNGCPRVVEAWDNRVAWTSGEPIPADNKATYWVPSGYQCGVYYKGKRFSIVSGDGK